MSGPKLKHFLQVGFLYSTKDWDSGILWTQKIKITYNCELYIFMFFLRIDFGEKSIFVYKYRKNSIDYESRSKHRRHVYLRFDRLPLKVTYIKNIFGLRYMVSLTICVIKNRGILWDYRFKFQMSHQRVRFVIFFQK